MRKKYLKPEVESETYVEQTSLACNLIQGWETAGPMPLSPTVCPDDVTKGGNWYESVECDAVVSWDGRDCSPNTFGIPLS